jgi:hypothetical protein
MTKTLYGFIENGKYIFNEDQSHVHTSSVVADWPPSAIEQMACIHDSSQIVYNAQGFGVCEACGVHLVATGWAVVV